jgi:transposase-like protein
MPKKKEKKTLDLVKLARLYSDEVEAYKFLESIRWPDGAICPHCGVVGQAHYMAPNEGNTRKTTHGGKSYRRVWRCEACREQFSATVGTIFEGSKIPLSKWLLAIHEISADKNGVSSHELGRKLDITQKSAWFMAHRIREAIAATAPQYLTGIVEADETYFGGKAKNMHKSKREEVIQGRGTVGKVAVFAMVERGGKVRSRVMKEVNSKNISAVLNAHVDSEASLMTDTSTVYPGPGKAFASHEMVDHSADEYVRGDAYTNTAEGHFSQLKRSIDGTHHHVSEKHLDRYLAEFDYRYSTRHDEDGERTEKTIKRVSGKRLTYKALTQEPSEC